MKLAPDTQRQLITLATAQTRLHRLDDSAMLAQQRQLDDLLARRTAVREAGARAELERHDQLLEVGRMKEDAARMRHRVTDAKELLASSTDRHERKEARHEIAAVGRRLRTLDAAIDEKVAELTGSGATDLSDLDDAIATAQARLDETSAALDAERAARQAEFDEIAGRLPKEIVEEFLRQALDTGVGAVVFSGRTCSGCSMVLSPVEITEIRATPTDEVARCPQCGTFLVRA